MLQKKRSSQDEVAARAQRNWWRMTTVLMALAVVALSALYYVYDGYGRLLARMHRRQRSRGRYLEGEWPSVSIVVAAYNEEQGIAAKLDDLLAQDYPGPGPEIIVANDGSDDNTRTIVQGYSGRGVRIVDTRGREGKSPAQNLAVANATGDIIVLTDTDTSMEPGCLTELVAPFSAHEVGCTSGYLQFRPAGGSQATPEQGLYWNYELKLRRLETERGMLATAAGAIMAVRRNLWLDVPAEYGDDCVIPLDVVLQGKLVEQVDSARAWASFSGSVAGEYHARVRMTLRNWTGTFSRAALLSPRRYPRYAFALWSHKILRWLSPCLVALLFFATLLLYLTQGLLWPVTIVALGIIAGVAGLLALAAGKRLPVLSQLGSFALANAGFAAGLIKVLTRKRIRAYNNK